MPIWKESVCETCGKPFTYDAQVSKGRFCCHACVNAQRSQMIKNTYTPELRKRRSIDAKNQMKDPEQRNIRREKCVFERTPEYLAKMRASVGEAMKRPEVRKKLSEACKKMVDYTKIAKEAHGDKCQRCGKQLDVPGAPLVAHHIDGCHYIDDITDNSPENLMVLCNSCHAKLHHEMRRQADAFVGEEYFEQAAALILKGLKKMGFDPDYDNFHATPKRFARAYYEIFEGCVDTQKRIDEVLSTKFPSNGNESMVVAKDIVCFSMCPHHLLPVEYHVCVGYIPNKSGEVLGISKLGRLVTILAKRPALQEAFTKDIVDNLHKIGISGAIALVEGQHMCMRMRGAKAVNSTITTTAVSGTFADDASAKAEFMSDIQDRLKFR